MADPSKSNMPRPRVDEESKDFWEACARGELYVQECGDCGLPRHYPRALCPECLSDDVRWRRCNGRGSVYTFTVVYQNQSPGFRDKVPYVLAYVELEDVGLRLLTNLVGCEPGEARIGMTVEVVFDDLGAGVALPTFAPVL